MCNTANATGKTLGKRTKRRPRKRSGRENPTTDPSQTSLHSKIAKAKTATQKKVKKDVADFKLGTVLVEIERQLKHMREGLHKAVAAASVIRELEKVAINAAKESGRDREKEMVLQLGAMRAKEVRIGKDAKKQLHMKWAWTAEEFQEWMDRKAG